MPRLSEKFFESIKVLNNYRNLYHAESSSTEQYKVANAINDILPEFCRLIESDAEPVVRCRDCRFGTESQQEPKDYFVRCIQNPFYPEHFHKNHYCGFGAKKDKEADQE